MTPPRPLLLFKGLWWAARRDHRTVPHLLAVLCGAAANTVRLRVRRLARGRASSVLAIALVEHMGDIVAAEPVSRLARREHPEANLLWMARKPYRDVVLNYAAIDRVVTVRCMTEWLLLWSWRTVDIAWDLHVSQRPCPICGIHFHKDGPAGALTYETYYGFGNLLAVNCLSAGSPPIDDRPVLRPDGAARRRVDALGLPPRFVVVHCLSNDAERDWVLHGWHALVDWLTNEGWMVLEVGGKPFAITQDGERRRSLCGKLSIMETAELIRRATLFIGIDSGPAHLANAVGTRGVVLLGRYRGFASYTPYSGPYADGSGADLVRTDGLAREIPPATVIAAAHRRLTDK